MDENQAHKNMSNFLDYIFYGIRLSLPSHQVSFMALKSSVHRLISENVKNKNKCVPAGLIGEEDASLFFNRSFFGNFSLYFKYLADSGSLFVVLPVPILFHPISASQISETVKKLDKMDLCLDDSVKGLADRMAAVLYDSIYFSAVGNISETIKEIQAKLKNYLP